GTGNDQDEQQRETHRQNTHASGAAVQPVARVAGVESDPDRG
ncbi:MAG: hypothetical protein JWL83_1144, partial [Actinomycetia bacterium]|nr:hypothetical protein [Actinomycetes bacterium]